MSEETMNILIENLSLKDYTKVTKDISKLEQENQQLKKSIKLFTDALANMTNRALQLEKQKDDVVEYIKEHLTDNGRFLMLNEWQVPDLLRMLGEIDEYHEKEKNIHRF